MTVGALAAILAVLPNASKGAAQDAGCSGAGKPLAPLRNGLAREVLRCTINHHRSPNVTLNKDLRKAAQKHTDRMVRQRCFAHQCPGEPSLRKRIHHSGYAKGVRYYRFGEVLARMPARASARRIVKRWLSSLTHRQVIVTSGYRHVGVGIGRAGGRVFATAVLAARSR